METGQRGATLRDIRDLCDLYGITEEDARAQLMDLAREGKQPGWWQAYTLPYDTFIGLEQAATSMKIYTCAVVPGLMQTADYTRAIHDVGIPRFSDSVIEQRVQERATRQRLLAQASPPSVEVVLDEAVLHRPIGGSAAMRRQLDRIIAVSEYSTVTVQVLPYKAGAHPALESDFTILSFQGSAPSMVYVEGLVGQIYLERKSDIERYEQTFERLRDIAPSQEVSIRAIKKIRDTYASD